MRLHRFYVKHPLGEEVHIDERELVHQMSSVFRYTVGDSVLLFSLVNPSYDYEYSITEISKSSVTLSFVKKTKNILPTRKTTLYMSLVKKDTFETIARHATELLVTDIVPIVATRSEKKNLNFERLSTITKEAAEQCGRGDIPTLHPILSFKEAIIEANENHCVFDTGVSVTTLTKNIDSMWVGPEGGWAEEELEAFKNKDVSAVSLGSTILKADTAAIVGMAKLFLS